MVHLQKGGPLLQQNRQMPTVPPRKIEYYCSRRLLLAQQEVRACIYVPSQKKAPTLQLPRICLGPFVLATHKPTTVTLFTPSDSL